MQHFQSTSPAFSSLGVSTWSWRPKPSAMHVSSWGQFVAMLFCQLGRAHSLREICGGLASCEGKLHHLGIASPKRSTLSYANKHRPWQLYEKVFYRLRSERDRRASQEKIQESGSSTASITLHEPRGPKLQLTTVLPVPTTEAATADILALPPAASLIAATD